jgi:O-antigen/teichoic acid export membrane protein
MDSIRKNYIYNSIYQILSFLTPLITTPYISRILTVKGIGEYSFYYSIASYFVIFIMLGLNNYGNREVATVRNNLKKLTCVFWEIYFLQFSLGIFLTCIYFCYVFFMAQNQVIALAMSFYVISAIFDINWFFFGLEAFGFIVTRNVIVKIFSIILIFTCVHNKSDLPIYCTILTTSMLLSQVILWPYLFKKISYVKPCKKNVIKHLKPNLYLFLTVLAVSLYKTMDKIMLGILSSNKEVGYYESSEKMISLPIALVQSLGIVMLPRMSNLISRGYKSVGSLIDKSMMIALFISTSMCFGIMGISKEFIPLFYGKGFEKCKILFIILLPSCVFLAFANVIRTQYLLPFKKDNVYVKSAFIGAGINISLNLLLISYIGAIGAAIGTFFAELSVAMYQAYKAKDKLPIQKYVYLSIPFIMTGLVMFLILYMIPTGENLLISLVLKVIIGILIYLTAIKLFFVLKRQN